MVVPDEECMKGAAAGVTAETPTELKPVESSPTFVGGTLHSILDKCENKILESQRSRSCVDNKKKELRMIMRALQRHNEEKRRKLHQRSTFTCIDLTEEADEPAPEEVASRCSSPTKSCSPSQSEDESYEEGPPVALETFCGKAALTSALKKAGFAATGIDYKGSKDKAVARTIWLDLTRRATNYSFGT